MSTDERGAINNAVWLCQTCAKLVDNDQKRFTVETLISWKRTAEAAAYDKIGKTDTSVKPASSASEREIRRNLKIRDRLEKTMLRPAEERRFKRNARPPEKFRSHKIVIRSIDDTHYPEIDKAPDRRISSWFVVEPYDFYHGGLEVILSIRLAVIKGFWPMGIHRGSSRL